MVHHVGSLAVFEEAACPRSGAVAGLAAASDAERARLVQRPEPNQHVDALLGESIRVIAPRGLHPGQWGREGVSGQPARGCEAPLEVAPLKQPVMQAELHSDSVIPPVAHERQGVEPTPPGVAQLDPAEVAEQPRDGWNHGVQRAEDAEFMRRFGQRVLPAAAHVQLETAALTLIARARLPNKRRWARRRGVRGPGAAAEAALQREASALALRLLGVAAGAQGLEPLLRSGHRLA